MGQRQFRIIVAVLAGITFAGLRASAAGDKAAVGDSRSAFLKIGTYNSRMVALAWWRSPEGSKAIGQNVQRLRHERDQAKAAGDQKRVEQLQSQGADSQRHVQAEVFCNMPIDDVIAQLGPRLPRVAAEAGVVAIVPQADWKMADVQTVDVTDLIVKLCSPSSQTLRVVNDLPNHPPVDPWLLSQMGN